MPRALTLEEKNEIKARLREEAEACLCQSGFRKTSVNELVTKADIPKGTFYLLYPSKEALFYEVFEARHIQFQQEIVREIQNAAPISDSEVLADILYRAFGRAEHSFLITLITSGELRMLLRKQPPEEVNRRRREDRMLYACLREELAITEEHYDSFGGVLRTLLYAASHKKEIGEQNFDSALKVLLKGFTQQLLER